MGIGSGYFLNKDGDTQVRLVLILLLLLAAAMGGLFVYGQMLEPETQTITEEAAPNGE